MSSEPIPTNARRCRAAWLWLDGPVMTARYLPNIEVTLSDVKEMLALGFEIGGRPYPIFVDIRELRSMTLAARDHLASGEIRTTTTAVAIHIASPLSRVLGNFFIGFYKLHIPTRLFTDEADAKAWLLKVPTSVAA